MAGQEEPTATQGVQRAAPDGRRAYLLVIQTGSSSRFDLPVTGSVVIGRGGEADLQLQDPAASRRHAKIIVDAGQVSVLDLDSHNGTRVNGEPISSPRRLASGDVIAIGDALLVLHSEWLASRAFLDTGALRQRLEEEIERAVSYERPLGVIVLVLDGPRWDRAAVGQALQAALRGIDVVGHVGESQLAVLAPELPAEATAAVADSLAAALAARAGFADCPTDGCTASGLLGAALAAASLAEPSGARDAAHCKRELSFGGRAVWIADAAMIRLYQLIQQLARSDLTVLICGETGVGKENAAHAIHHGSPRARATFVTLNCAAIQETLVESELFGYEKGAFTGAVASKPGLLEAAHGGTVFLDEVGELSAATQAKLLRALETKRITRVGGLQERAIDIRIVAATNRNLEEEVKAGRFRQDLFFRLGVATVVIPPLRERPRELAILAQLFLDQARSRMGAPAMILSAGAMSQLGRHPWPGNVRELKNIMELAAATGTGTVLEAWQLPERLAPPPVASADEEPSKPDTGKKFRALADELREIERRRMQEALDAAGGVQKHAAKLIDMPLRTFVEKVKLYGLIKARRPT
jgi:DNA-binding NtrC family response regulator/pSer/pThr/pTyr-binding forkhead associated (FHA) protein